MKRWVAGMVVSVVILAGCSGASGPGKVFRYGAPTFAEAKILAYMSTALVEANTGCKGQATVGLGSSPTVDQAVQAGELDAMTGWTGGVVGLQHPKLRDEVDVTDSKWKDQNYLFNWVRENQEKKLGRTWIGPLGFENTYAVSVRRSFAEENGIKTISDLAKLDTSKLIIGMDDYYITRQNDGYEPLLKTYGMKKFKQVVQMNINLLYQALRDRQVDVGVAYSTDARIAAFDLVWLQDDKRIYLPFDAGIVITLDVEKRCPGATKALSQLAGQFTVDEMRRLNGEVDLKQREPEDVAKEWLRQKGLLK